MDVAVSSTPTKDGLFTPQVPEPRPGRRKGSAGPGIFHSLRLLATFVRNPLEAAAAPHFEVPFDQSRFFGRIMTLVNDPALIRYFFVENAANYRQGDIRQAVLKPALREGLLTAEGESWRHARKTMAPVFTPRNVHGFAGSMRRTVERFADGLQEGSAPLAPMMSELTYKVLSEALFSGEISADSEAMLADVALFLHALGHPDPLDVLGAPDWVPRPTKLRGRSSIGRLRSRVRELIASRAARMAAGESVPRDFATLLLEAGGETMGHDEIEDNLITFIGAGHETTARGLAWALYLIANDESVRRRIEAEIDALDMDSIPAREWVDRLAFTRACFEEAMRLYPPASAIARVAIADDSHNGIFVPAGSTVLLNTWVLHRHKLYWENPDAFDPDRFMGEKRKAIDRFAYLPFGLGPRICIGASFALQEAVILLAILLKRYRFDYSGDRPPWPVMRITVQPHNGMPMTITAR